MVDTYTKIVWTVIALCLLSLTFRGTPLDNVLETVVEAQGGRYTLEGGSFRSPIYIDLTCRGC